MGKLGKLHKKHLTQKNALMTQVMITVKESSDILQQQRDLLKAQGLKGDWEEFERTAFFAESTEGLNQNTLIKLRQLWGALK